MYELADRLREPGFFGTHATMGADVSQFMATLFTMLFIVGWVQAKKNKADTHHWLMFGGMISMLAFFICYYLFRSLGVLAFEGKEGFGGSQWLYDNVFSPILVIHIFLVMIGLVMAIYMIVLGFRAQFFKNDKRNLKDEELFLTWRSIGKALGLLSISLFGVCVLFWVVGWLTPTRIIVALTILFLVLVVQGIELGILQRIWPNGARRHRVLGKFTMMIYCVLFVTGTATYTMLYILYPGKIG